MKVSEVLYGAADYVAAFGHCKGAFSDGPRGTSSVCMLGAIATVVCVDNTNPQQAVAALQAQVGGSVVRFNDNPSTTAEMVVEAFTACAVIEAAKEAAAEQVAQDAALAGVAHV